MPKNKSNKLSRRFFAKRIDCKVFDKSWKPPQLFKQENKYSLSE